MDPNFNDDIDSDYDDLGVLESKTGETGAGRTHDDTCYGCDDGSHRILCGYCTKTWHQNVPSMMVCTRRFH